MNSRSADVLVAGAGVAGLTTAVCLAEAGLAVTVVADRPPGETTSVTAGAIWGPHLVEASERADRWGLETLAVLRDLAGEPGTGVHIASGVTASRAHLGPDLPQEIAVLARADLRPGPPAPQAGAATGAAASPGLFVRCAPAELPSGFSDGWRYAAPLVDMPLYLDYLAGRLERAGAALRTGKITSLVAAARAAGAAAVVNCTGAGARVLARDPEVVPVRGQIVVAANPGVTEFFIGLPDGAHELVYLFPHGATVVLGGTQMAGEDSLDPDPAAATRILRDCAEIEPALREARVLSHRVGLRPARPLVRLEAGTDSADAADDVRVVHNYGHGGAGITLSWGCAREAAALVQDAGAPR